MLKLTIESLPFSVFTMNCNGSAFGFFLGTIDGLSSPFLLFLKQSVTNDHLMCLLRYSAQKNKRTLGNCLCLLFTILDS